MSEIQGMLSAEALADAVASDEIDTVIVAFTDLYGRLVGKRFDAGYFVRSIAKAGTHGCDYLFTVDMEMDPIAGYRFANWESGYGDVHLVPDLSTLRRAAWLDRTALVLCDVERGDGHEPVPIAPRSILKAQIARAHALGYTAAAASELEFYIFEDSYRDAAGKNWTGLTPSGWYIEDYHTLQGSRVEDLVGAARRELSASGVPVENSKGEWGLGQHEINVRYADALSMADRHVVYKQCLKEIADRAGRSVSFMPKYSTDGAGSSCHIHLSLWQNGRNAFAGQVPVGSVQASDVFRWFLGGWLRHTADVMAFYAPTINAYKRYQAGSWAPTGIAWSRDNRTAGYRVVGSGESLRIECRVPGADCNPYLALAAALASGLEGIEQRIEPPAMFEGDVYAAADSVPKVPSTLRAAADQFSESEFTVRVFGEDVVEHYTHFFRTEQAAYDEAVTDWERRRYFERI